MAAFGRAVLAGGLLVAAALSASGIAPETRAEPAAPRVVVSIKPLHSLAAAVMAGVGEPLLLIDGAGSPHAFSLRPSQAAALDAADLVVWVGPSLESFLVAPMETLVGADRSLQAIELAGIDPLPLRGGGIWDGHGHGHGADVEEDTANNQAGTQEAEARHDGALERAIDPHLWLDPARAAIIAEAITHRLAAIDPVHAARYDANLDGLREQIDRLVDDTDATLEPVRTTPFIVFHDGYQYFEARFELAAAGSIALDPEQAPSAARLADIRGRLADGDVVCAFAEPQFDPGLLETAVEGTGVEIATLDPLGADLMPGPDLYGTLIRRLATALANCLAGPA